jgi:hypothetical protein
VNSTDNDNIPNIPDLVCFLIFILNSCKNPNRMSTAGTRVVAFSKKEFFLLYCENIRQKPN